MKNIDYELSLLNKGFCKIAGCDEAGRGPLAGPIVAAAIVFDFEKIKNRSRFIKAVKDSKKLTSKRRELLCEVIKKYAVSWGIGIVESSEIDKIGISEANRKCIQLAIESLSIQPDFIVCDYVPYLQFQQSYDIIKQGDIKIFSIAAASILAKVERDKIMLQYDEKFPEYGFKKHKGYGTQEHIKNIKIFGKCPIHRNSFKIKK